MNYRTFSIRLPEEIAIKLDAEARQRFFKNRGRTQLLVEILSLRYLEEPSEPVSPRKSVTKTRPRPKKSVAKIPSEG